MSMLLEINNKTVRFKDESQYILTRYLLTSTPSPALFLKYMPIDYFMRLNALFRYIGYGDIIFAESINSSIMINNSLGVNSNSEKTPRWEDFVRDKIQCNCNANG